MPMEDVDVVSSQYSSSVEGSESISSKESSSPTPTAARTASRQLGVHMSDTYDEIRQGQTRRQTRIIRQQSQGPSSLVAISGPNEEGQIARALVAEQAFPGDKEFPNCTVQEARLESTSYATVCSSEYADVWGKSMEAEFDGLVAVGTLSVISEVPGG